MIVGIYKSSCVITTLDHSSTDLMDRVFNALPIEPLNF